MSNRQNLYIGRSGQLAVMAEFLERGYNVAIPEIDVGEDIFVVRDADGELYRIQVKAAVNKLEKKVAGKFSLPIAQLERAHEPELNYVLTLHNGGFWSEFIILERRQLEKLVEKHQMGHEAEGNLLLYLAFSEHDVKCSGASLQRFRGDWSKWPPIIH